MKAQNPLSNQPTISYYKMSFIILALLVCFSAAFLKSNSSRIFLDCTETGDYAANALSVESAKESTQLLGPYSRFKFHHPGPIIFYIRSISEWLFKSFEMSPYTVHTLSQFSLNIACLFLALLIIGIHLNRILEPFLVFIALWYGIYSVDTSFWLNTWGPTSVILPTFLFLIASASLAAGKKHALPIMIISGTIALQTHLGTASTVLAVGFISTLLFMYKINFRKSFYTILANSFLLLFLWAPTILELFISKKNNFTRVMNFRQNYSGTHTFHEIVEFLTSFYSPNTVAQKELWLFIFLLFVLLLPFKNNKFLFLLKIFLGLTIVTTAAYVKNIHGSLYGYLSYYHYAFAALGYSLIFIFILQYLPRNKILESTCILLSFLSVSYFSYNHYFLIGNPLCSDAIDNSYSKIAPQNNTLYVLKIASKKDKKAWSDIAGVALKLKREGYSFCVPNNWGYLYGRKYTCSQVQKGLESHITETKNIHFTLNNITIHE